MSRRLPLLALLLFSGCVVGAPPGFSDGDVWTAPLVAPLENHLLLVPVKINDTGPYLFMVDPDSERSSLDELIVRDLELYTRQGRSQLTEADNMVETFQSEVKTLTVGDLTVRNMKLRVHEFNTYHANGRRVRGVLGGDVIADSLIVAADRDRGLLTIATQGNIKAPAGAEPVGFRRFYGHQLAKTRVDGSQVELHLDLGARSSMLWPQKLEALGLRKVGMQTTLIDEYGAERKVTSGAVASKVKLGPHAVEQVTFLPYGDKRIDEEDYDGALGQDFFSEFHVTVNWHDKKFWLKRRDADLVATGEERIRRWGDTFAGCENTACVKAKMAPVGGPPAETETETETETEAETEAEAEAEAETDDGAEEADDGAGKPAPATQPSPPQEPASYTLLVEREEASRDFSYDVLLEALGPDGEPLGLPRLLVTLPEGAPAVTRPNFDPNYAQAARFAVLDVSPFPRECQRTGRGVTCIWQMALHN